MKFNKIRIFWNKLPIKEKVLTLLLISILILGCVLLINKAYNRITKIVPTQGGIWRIGEIGSPRFINPILTQTNDTDRDLEELIYSGLFKNDGQGNFVPDLAEKSEISPDGKTYDIYLKNNVLWHDGMDFTSDDVIFTINTIQDTEYSSPLRLNWQGVIAEKINDSMVRFHLRNPYQPFLQNLTIKILPQHIWQNIQPKNFSLAEYNLKPIGTGPYRFEQFQKNQDGKILNYKLEANNNYFGGKPNISTVVIYFFDNFDQAIKSLLKKDVDSLSEVSLDKYPTLKNKGGFKIENLILPRYYAVFFNANKNRLFSDAKIKKALSEAIDKDNITKNLLSNQAYNLNAPISPGFIGYDPSLNASSYNLEDAIKILSDNGWQDVDNDGFREKTLAKEKQPTKLEITLTFPKNDQLQAVASFIKDSWAKIGVKTNIQGLPIIDLEKDYIRPRQYEALLFGNVIGVEPDLFAFWHSSQKSDPGLNLSMYANNKLDALLEETRQISDTDKITANLEKIQEILNQDIPAIFLYNPYYLYIDSKSLKGNNTKIVNYPSERLSNISTWYLYTKRVVK